MADDFHDLDRFVVAQASAYPAALAELRAGEKRSHWMWYVFPQIAGLGHSAMARRYAIGSLEAAAAYLAHPLLGARLRECVGVLDGLLGVSAARVFGAVDAMKLRSSLTLFVKAGAEAPLERLLDRWFGGPDEATLAILAQQAANISSPRP